MVLFSGWSAIHFSQFLGQRLVDGDIIFPCANNSHSILLLQMLYCMVYTRERNARSISPDAVDIDQFGT